MRGKITVIIIASVVLYLLLVSALFFASAFKMSWGGEIPWYLSLMTFVSERPLNLIRSNGEIKISFIFLNAFFWTLCIATLLYFLARLISKND